MLLRRLCKSYNLYNDIIIIIDNKIKKFRTLAKNYTNEDF